jgi:eukaryotic-like serine/threonine-protein kinase
MTPDYASPEQIRGDPVTTAADVYSLGTLLYELLAGVRPYPLTGATSHEAARIVFETEPSKPSSRASATGVKLPDDLDFITLKAMRKAPQDRYGSAQELANDVTRYLDGLPVLARRGSFRYVARKMVVRHKLAVATVLACAALAAIGVSAIVREAHVANMERAKAQNRFDELRGLANSVIFELHDDIARLSGSTEVRKKLVTRALAYLDSLAKESAGDVGLQTEVAAAYLRLGDVLGKPSEPNLGDPAGALASYQKGLSVAEAALSRNPSRDDLLRQMGLIYLGIG